MFYYYIMENSTIIKLRQSESTDISTNGSFKTTIASEGIVVEEGDIIKLHTIVLDTSLQAIVRLDEDLEVDMTTIKYIRNIENPGATINQLEYTLDPASVPAPDLKNYFSCAAINTGVDDYRVTFCGVAPLQRRVKTFGGIWLTFDFTDVDGTVLKDQAFHLLPQFTKDHPKSKPFEFPINRLVKGQSFVCTNSPTDFFKANIQPIGPLNITFVGPLVGATKTLIPIQERLKFIIKKGTYTPPEIGQIITDKMSSYNSLGATGDNYPGGRFPVNNPFFSTIGREHYNTITPSEGGSATNDYYLIPDVKPQGAANVKVMDNIMKFEFGGVSTLPTTLATDRTIGASQTSLNFDNNLKKMNFDVLQTPYFISPTGDGAGVYVPGVVYPVGDDNKGNPIVKEPQQAHSGIAFTHLGARQVIDYIYKDNQDPPQDILPPTPVYGKATDFWRDLGFDDILVPIVHDGTVLTLDGGEEVIACQIEVEYGKNITGTFLGNDVVVDKDVLWALPSQVDTITSLTTPIIAARTFDTSGTNDEGYYLIEIGVKIPQKMLGGDAVSTLHSTSSNKVQAILGKYFTNGNFLQDTGSSGIVYQHVGAPQMLNDLDVRVLHADGSPPLRNELGPKNSIFLEVIKQRKMPKAMLKKKQEEALEKSK